MSHSVYHIISPLARFQNLPKLIEMLSVTPAIWHPIMDEGLPFTIQFHHPWIKPSFCSPASPFWKFFAKALNRFVDAGRIFDDHRYMILNDDDGLEPDFFKKLDEHDGELLIVGMKRGDKIPAGLPAERAHGTSTLEAKPENLEIGKVGAEQMISSGRILRTCHWEDNISADGMNIIETCKRHKPAFVPDCYVKFNFLEEGRWLKA